MPVRALRHVIAAALLCFVLLLAVGVSAVSAGPSMGMKTGDVNTDGAANSLDALDVLFYNAGLLGTQSKMWSSAADVNCDLAVNAVDASVILQHDAGLYHLRP